MSHELHIHITHQDNEVGRGVLPADETGELRVGTMEMIEPPLGVVIENRGGEPSARIYHSSLNGIGVILDMSLNRSLGGPHKEFTIYGRQVNDDQHRLPNQPFTVGLIEEMC